MASSRPTVILCGRFWELLNNQSGIRGLRCWGKGYQNLRIAHSAYACCRQVFSFLEFSVNAPTLAITWPQRVTGTKRAHVEVAQVDGYVGEQGRDLDLKMHIHVP